MADPVRAYFLKNRESMFPDIKDFSQDFMGKRQEKDVRKLKWTEWFWFHPSAFKLIYYGSLVMPMIFFIVIGIVFIHKPVVPIISFPVSAICAWEIARKYRIRQTIVYQTFYDTFVRD